MEKQELERFGLTRFSYDNDVIEFDTGFPTYELYMIFFIAIQPSAARMISAYHNASDELSSRGRPRSMGPIHEVFMFLCRLKCGFLAEDLAVRFKIHKSSVSRQIITWTNYLYFLL